MEVDREEQQVTTPTHKHCAFSIPRTQGAIIQQLFFKGIFHHKITDKINLTKRILTGEYNWMVIMLYNVKNISTKSHVQVS